MEIYCIPIMDIPFKDVNKIDGVKKLQVSNQ